MNENGYQSFDIGTVFQIMIQDTTSIILNAPMETGTKESLYLFVVA